MFHLRAFSVDIPKKCKSNHYLLLLVIFHDLRMTQLWSVKYICLSISKILIVDMSEILGNMYDIPVAIAFGTVFFSIFWRLQKLVF